MDTVNFKDHKWIYINVIYYVDNDTYLEFTGPWKLVRVTFSIATQ